MAGHRLAAHAAKAAADHRPLVPDADAPSSIPVRGWREVLGRALRRVYEDRLLTEAAAVAFYALLAPR